MTAVLERTLDQRMLALRYANRVRSYRAVLKRRVKAGEVSVRVLLAEPPVEIETMRVLTLLLAMPGVGAKKAAYMMQRVQIASGKTVSGLSDRQRAELLRVCDGRQP